MMSYTYNPEAPLRTFASIVASLFCCVIGSTLALSPNWVIFFGALLFLFFVKWSLPMTWNYDYIEDQFKDSTEEEVQYHFHNRAKELPPHFYPNGWALTVEVRDVPFGGRKAFMAFGKQVLYYRAKITGKPQVVVLNCPVSGVDLGKEGIIEGCSIYCTHCGKQISDEGCAVPFAEFRELHGFVYVWHHADGIKPTWEAIAIPQIVEGKQVWRGTTHITVACHPQEPAENTADDGHVNYVHSNGSIAGVLGVNRNWINYKRLFRLESSMEWSKHRGTLNDEKIVSFSLIQITIFIFGFPVTVVQMPLRNEGPYGFTANFNLAGQNVLLILGFVPVDNMRTTVVISIFGGRYTPLLPVFLAEEFCQLLRDGIVWNNKVYKRNPIWVKRDGWKMTKDWRHWYSQFYSDTTGVNHMCVG